MSREHGFDLFMDCTKIPVVIFVACRIVHFISVNLFQGKPLHAVLRDVDQMLISKGVHPDHSGASLMLITDGQLHIRLGIHAEASHKKLPLESYWFKFCDLRKEVQRYFNTGQVNIVATRLSPHYVCVACPAVQGGACLVVLVHILWLEERSATIFQYQTGKCCCNFGSSHCHPLCSVFYLQSFSCCCGGTLKSMASNYDRKTCLIQ